MTLTDAQAIPPTCAVCGRDASAGYYDSRAENHFCDRICFEEWADDNIRKVIGFYRRMNLE